MKKILSLIIVTVLCLQSFAVATDNSLKQTRGEVVMKLWEDAGFPEVNSDNNNFTDISPDSSYYKAILWAAEWGIAKGTSETTFEPDELCIKEHKEIFMKRYEEKKLLEDAYIFTLPLMMMDATCTKMTNTVKATAQQAPVNQIIHAENLATAEFKDVVTPNVDTIYSQIVLDLSEDAVILEMPKTYRFCTAQVIDAYTNCVTVLDASEFETESGKFIFTTEKFKEEIPEGMIQVKSPTSMVWIIVRTICFNKEDEANVHAIQNKMNTYTYKQFKEGTIDKIPEGAFDEKNNFVPSTHVLQMSMEEYFERANILMAENPPADEDKAMIERIAKIGIGPNLSFNKTELSIDTESLWESLVSGIVENTTLESAKFLTMNGQWSYMGEPIAEFGTEYAYRALISVVGLGANPVSVAVYPKAQTDSEGGRLNGENNYILHFEKDQLPPVKGNGFWSVTAYTSKDNFLIDNEIDRYCINNRSEVTYNEDGSLDIYIQKEKPADKESNWLPVVGEEFHLILRVYRPDDSVVAGEWKTPIILKNK